MAIPRRAPRGLQTSVGLGALAGAGWLGLRVAPAPFPPYLGPTAEFETTSIPDGLPPPVERYLRAAVGERLPVLESAVLTARGRMRLGGVTFPTRLRFVLLAGRGYRHEIECTWFGLRVLRADETYLDGHARLKLPFGTVANQPKVDRAANVNLWGESFWLPSALVTSPRVRWEPVDSITARLAVPFGQEEDRCTVTFDEQTGLVRRMAALRYRSAADDTMTPWRFDALAWQTFAGLRIPSTVALTWLDEGSPWLEATVEDAAYNVDVSTNFAPHAL